MSVPLTTRKNIRDSEPKLKESLEKIQNATGKEWSFEADWAKLIAAPEVASYKDTIGDVIQGESMQYLAQNIVKLCENESSKEAFIEATSTAKIVFRVNPKQQDYWVIKFENGDLVCEFKAIANVYQIGNFNIVAIIPTPGLPLTVRLNLEQNKERQDVALERIGKTTGESDWAFESDYEKAVAQLDKYSSERIGEIYGEVLEYFAQLMENKMKNEAVKESFLEATTARKIVIRINDKSQDYWNLQFQNGEIILEHKKSIANVYQIGNFALEKLIPSPGGLSLVQRLNIAENKEKLDEKMEELRNATGEEWALEIDYEKVVKDLGKDNQYSCDRIGEIYQEAVGYFVQNISKLVKEGDTVKEAFMEATPDRKITFQVNDKAKDYWTITIKDGGVLVEHKKQIANVYQLGNIDIKPLIPSPGGLSLVTRVNIEQHKEKVDEILQEIAKAAGTEDWTFEPDYEKAAKELDQYSINRIGEIYAEALGYLRDNIKKTVEKETVKEAFIEATPDRKIVFRVNDKCPDYWKLKFENGSILVEHKKQIANVYQLGNQNIPEALPVPGVLSLLARLNLEENREKLTEALEKIKNATGEEYTFDDACVEEVYKKLPDVKHNIGAMISEIMENFANLIEKSMKDEMVKEAYNEVATAHQVTVRIDPKQSDYWGLKFENGNVVIIGKAYANLYQVSNLNIEKLL